MNKNYNLYSENRKLENALNNDHNILNPNLHY